MDTNSFIAHVKTDDIYKDIAEDLETRFDTSNFELDRQLPKEKNKKVNWANKRYIKWTNQEGFVGLGAKAHSCLKDNNDEDKKLKGKKKIYK